MKDKELLDLVRLAMTERNVSQRDMAREMETSPQNVSHWLDRTETLSKMARAKLKAWLGDRYGAPCAPDVLGRLHPGHRRDHALGHVRRLQGQGIRDTIADDGRQRRGLTGSPALRQSGRPPVQHGTGGLRRSLALLLSGVRWRGLPRPRAASPVDVLLGGELLEEAMEPAHLRGDVLRDADAALKIVSYAVN